jgi:GNAT superfamily N-acetyltransferase
MKVTVRAARPEDVDAVFGLISALADYERLLHEVEATPEQVEEALFGASPRVFCDLAEIDGEVVGFGLWFYTFSTFRGKHGLYLEDLFVQPDYRKHGVGRTLLGHLAARCVAEDLGRLEWSVLDWNEPAIAFYRSLGARLMDGWTMCRLDGSALQRLAEREEHVYEAAIA